MVMVEVAGLPGATVAGDKGPALIVKLGAATVKLTAALWVTDPEVPVTAMLVLPAGVVEIVVKVSVDVAETEEPGVTEVGTNAQLTPAGRVAGTQVRLTEPANPFLALTVMVDVPDCPGPEIVTGLPPIEKSGVASKVGHEVTRRLASIEPKPVTRS
jgi:hypothetical protein